MKLLDREMASGKFVWTLGIFAYLITCTSAVIPAVDYFTQPANIVDDPTVETRLVEIDATDADNDVITSCQITKSSPNGPFRAQKKPADTKWCVYYDDSQNLNYATVNFYKLEIQCTANKENSNTVNLFVYVQPNSPPTIKDYPAASVTLDVSKFNAVTDTVYILTVTDPEKDPITFSMKSQQPNLGLFSITSATGEITATQDLRNQIVDSSFILTVSVSDTKHVIDDFKVLVTLDNLNRPPVFLNLPTTVSVLETAGTGTSLITLSVEDSTQYPGPIVPTCTTVPAAEGYKFLYDSADSTIKLTADNSLDHEVRNTYDMTCKVTDGYYTSISTLTVNILNVNEDPQFNSPDFYCSITEGKQRVDYCTLPLTVDDPEGYALQSIKFRTAINSEKFYFDNNTKRVYFNADYNIDGNSMPTAIDLILEATDSQATTATATVHINVGDANDNACQFNKNVIYQKISQNTALGLLDSFTLSDRDLTSPNNVATVQIVSQSPSNSGDYITVNDAGEVYLVGTVPPANSGSSYTMLVRCKDGGIPSLTSYATVVVSYTYEETTTAAITTTTTPSTTTTSKPEKAIWDYDWFVAVFAILMALVLASLIAALAFLIYKCCCRSPYVVPGTPRNTNKVEPRNEGNRRQGHHRDNHNDDFPNSARSYNKHTWSDGGVASPRQIPALEYK